MDLENLKQVWNEEKIESIPEISLEKQKEIHTPLEMIRKNMRTEFWTSIVFFSFVGCVLPFLRDGYQAHLSPCYTDTYSICHYRILLSKILYFL